MVTLHVEVTFVIPKERNYYEYVMKYKRKGIHTHPIPEDNVYSVWAGASVRYVAGEYNPEPFKEFLVYFASVKPLIERVPKRGYSPKIRVKAELLDVPPEVFVLGAGKVHREMERLARQGNVTIKTAPSGLDITVVLETDSPDQAIAFIDNAYMTFEAIANKLMQKERLLQRERFRWYRR